MKMMRPLGEFAKAAIKEAPGVATGVAISTVWRAMLNPTTLTTLAAATLSFLVEQGPEFFFELGVLAVATTLISMNKDRIKSGIGKGMDAAHRAFSPLAPIAGAAVLAFSPMHAPQAAPSVDCCQNPNAPGCPQPKMDPQSDPTRFHASLAYSYRIC